MLVERSREVREGHRKEIASSSKQRGKPWEGFKKGSELIIGGIVAVGLWKHEPNSETSASCTFQCDLDFQLPKKL